MNGNDLNTFVSVLFRKRGELRILGAISLDLNGISDGATLDELDEKKQINVKLLPLLLFFELSQTSKFYFLSIFDFHQVIHEILKEFCANSTVHGVRYFTEQKRHWTER